MTRHEEVRLLIHALKTVPQFGAVKVIGQLAGKYPELFTMLQDLYSMTNGGISDPVAIVEAFNAFVGEPFDLTEALSTDTAFGDE
jgi:hypothetical protein